jgi:hypothetical protein
MRYVITAAVAITALVGIFVFQSADAPEKMLTVNDRAAWGIGEDGARIAPPPATIRINLE